MSLIICKTYIYTFKYYCFILFIIKNQTYTIPEAELRKGGDRY